VQAPPRKSEITPTSSRTPFLRGDPKTRGVLVSQLIGGVSPQERWISRRLSRIARLLRRWKVAAHVSRHIVEDCAREPILRRIPLANPVIPSACYVVGRGAKPRLALLQVAADVRRSRRRRYFRGRKRPSTAPPKPPSEEAFARPWRLSTKIERPGRHTKFEVCSLCRSLLGQRN